MVEKSAFVRVGEAQLLAAQGELELAREIGALLGRLAVRFLALVKRKPVLAHR